MTIDNALASYPELNAALARSNLAREDVSRAVGSTGGYEPGFNEILLLARKAAATGAPAGAEAHPPATASTASSRESGPPQSLDEWAELPAHRYTAPEIMETMYKLYGHLDPHPYTGGFDNRTPIYGAPADFQKLQDELTRKGHLFNDRHYRFVDIATTGGKAPLITPNNLGDRGILLPGVPQAGSGYISSDSTGHQPYHQGMYRYFADDPLLERVMTTELVKYDGLTPAQAQGRTGPEGEAAETGEPPGAEASVYAALRDFSDLADTVQEVLSPLMAQQLYHLVLSGQQDGVEQFAQYVPYDHFSAYQRQMLPYLWAGLIARISGETALVPVTGATVAGSPDSAVLTLNELQIDRHMAELLGGHVSGGTFYLPAYIAAAFSESDKIV